jgi:hypothetical protein
VTTDLGVSSATIVAASGTLWVSDWGEELLVPFRLAA